MLAEKSVHFSNENSFYVLEKSYLILRLKLFWHFERNGLAVDIGK